MVSGDGEVMFFNNTKISARDKVPSFQDISNLCGRGCSCPPRRVLDRAFFIRGADRFFHFCHSGVLYLSGGPGGTRCGLTRLRGTKGLSTIIARGVSKLRRTTNDGHICRLRKDILHGCYVGYNGFCSTRFVGGSTSVPGYAYKNVVGPSIILCRRKLSSDAMANTIGTVSGTSALVVTNADLAICPTTKFVHCFNNSGLILVGHSPAPVSGGTGLIFRRGIKRLLSGVAMGVWGLYNKRVSIVFLLRRVSG